jgi:serine/threonine-protein phosphatase CPPED1
MKKLVRENPIKITLAFLCILSFIGLSFWNSYAPLSIHGWNKKEISRMRITNGEDFTFAVFGDNKGDYSFFDPLLQDIGRDKEIAFAIDIGDLVGDGKRSQYRRFLNQVRENLTIPFLTATGNHDFNNGFDNYTSIFGPTYYAFRAGQCSFFVLDATNDSGFDQTERQWLEDELKKTQDAKARFVFMHIPPFDPRGGGIYLSEEARKDLQELFTRYKVTHLFTSHIHGYFSGRWEDVPYTITGGAGARLQGNDPEHFFHHYMKVHVSNGRVDLTVKRINAENAILRLYSLTKYYPFEGGLLLCFVITVLALWFSVRRRRDNADKNGEPKAHHKSQSLTK